jgi:predicted hotdog family 3-hydroxylacyl-ACP dehydratase
MVIGKIGLVGLMPHSGAMCLLDGVVSWNEIAIRCVAESHRRADHPLGCGGLLPIAAGIEYAAQAMAVHGGLTGSLARQPRAGYLASLRDVVFGAQRLDTLASVLVIDVERQLMAGARVIYDFRLSCEGTVILSGRAAVVLEACN